jgi:GDPmannose 4,6-dehydratase
MKALIYGITGQDGAYLAKFLLKNGYEVWGVSRDSAVADFFKLQRLDILGKVKLISAALNDFRSVLSSLVTADPDEIYNLAGQSSVALSFEQPVEAMESITVGILNLLEAIRFSGKNIKLYNASSSECFGDLRDERATEQTLFRPHSPYGVAKAAAHWEVVTYREAYSLFACNGILFNHESPLRPERFVTKGSKEKIRLGNIEIVRDWGWAPEYVQAMWQILQQDEAEDFVIATGESHSLAEFVECAFGYVGLDHKQYIELDSALVRPREIQFSYADPSRAMRVLNWKATTKMQDVIEMILTAEIGGDLGIGNTRAAVTS